MRVESRKSCLTEKPCLEVMEFIYLTSEVYKPNFVRF